MPHILSSKWYVQYQFKFYDLFREAKLSKWNVSLFGFGDNFFTIELIIMGMHDLMCRPKVVK